MASQFDVGFELLSTADLVFLKLAIVGVAIYGLHWFRAWATFKPAEPLIRFNIDQRNQKSSGHPPITTRSIHKALEQFGKQCIVLYGSQTGSAEKLAQRFGKDMRTKYGMQCLVAGLDDYDYEDLKSLHSGKLAVFILATYGDGEPTDNAISFDHYVQSSALSADQSLSNLKYAIFGLGSSSYQQFNAFAKHVDTQLRSNGASRLGDLGLGDDGKGTLEDDYIVWRDATLEVIAGQLNLTERPYFFEPLFDVKEIAPAPTEETFLGEPNRRQLRKIIKGPYTSTNPFPAPITQCRPVFHAGLRQCLHIEFDISDSTLTFQTGDHVAIRPINAKLEVDRFLVVFGLWNKRHTEIRLTTRDPTVNLPIPATTTYEAMAEFYLDLCGPVSRHVLKIMAEFAPDAGIQERVLSLANDLVLFRNQVTDRCLNISQILSEICPSKSWSNVPLSLLLENLSVLKPRYYSISSSSLVSRRTIAVTSVVESRTHEGWSHQFNGVSTGYLSALARNIANPDAPSSLVTHNILGPRNGFNIPSAFVSVRKSNFRLPKNHATPIIMIGPGTGVAPFRAFVQERAYLCSVGRLIGKTILYYGCRSSEEDFLYREEWKELESKFAPGTFEMHIAFSRQEAGRKVYVQDLFKRHVSELQHLILESDARVYVCGDAHRMARSVFTNMAQELSSAPRFNGDAVAAEVYLSEMRSKGRWLEDVW